MTETLTSKQAAEVLGIHTSTLTALQHKGELMPVSREGRSNVYDKAAVERLAVERPRVARSKPKAKGTEGRIQAALDEAQKQVTIARMAITQLRDEIVEEVRADIIRALTPAPKTQRKSR